MFYEPIAICIFWILNRYLIKLVRDLSENIFRIIRVYIKCGYILIKTNFLKPKINLVVLILSYMTSHIELYDFLF